jgi:hypothetical protein
MGNGFAVIPWRMDLWVSSLGSPLSMRQKCLGRSSTSTLACSTEVLGNSVIPSFWGGGYLHKIMPLLTIAPHNSSGKLHHRRFSEAYLLSKRT